MSKSNILEIPTSPGSQTFTQFIADNVDHNIVTLNGQGTFHGMGILASTVGSGDFNVTGLKLRRPTKLLKVVDVMSNSIGVCIRDYVPPSERLFSRLKLKPLAELNFPYVLPKSLNFGICWNIAQFLSSSENPQPSWSGYMHKMTAVEGVKKSVFTFLPIIPMNPSTYTCIYSTLTFIQEQC